MGPAGHKSGVLTATSRYFVQRHPIVRELSWNNSVSKVKDQGLSYLGLVPSRSRPTLWPNQSPSHWVLGILSQGILQLRCEADLASYLLQRIRMYGYLYLCPLYAFVEWCLGTGTNVFIRG
jgi:hypothetical protein